MATTLSSLDELEQRIGASLIRSALHRSESTGDLTAVAVHALCEDAAKLAAQCELLAIACQRADTDTDDKSSPRRPDSPSRDSPSERRGNKRSMLETYQPDLPPTKHRRMMEEKKVRGGQALAFLATLD